MKDEIKEILDGLNVVIKQEGSLELDFKECKKALDYITNLQIIEKEYSALLSENAELENKITNLQEEIERLAKELKLKTDFIEELLTIISVARDYELHDCYTRSKIYQDKLKELKEGK